VSVPWAHCSPSHSPLKDEVPIWSEKPTHAATRISATGSSESVVGVSPETEARFFNEKPPALPPSALTASGWWCTRASELQLVSESSEWAHEDSNLGPHHYQRFFMCLCVWHNHSAK
jgi:hypothetical protein